MSTVITREAAIDRLYQLINSGVFEKDVEDDLQDIANCIEDEKQLRIHSWGMNADEYGKLHTAWRTDLPDYDSKAAEQERIVKKYRFKEVGDENI